MSHGIEKLTRFLGEQLVHITAEIDDETAQELQGMRARPAARPTTPHAAAFTGLKK